MPIEKIKTIDLGDEVGEMPSTPNLDRELDKVYDEYLEKWKKEILKHIKDEEPEH